MKESEVLSQVSLIVSKSESFAEGLEQVRILLEGVLGAQALHVELPAREPSSPKDLAARTAAELLDTLERPYRSFYVVPLRGRGKELGKLVACYADDESRGAVLERVSNFVGQQLGMLWERTCLAQNRARLEKQLAAVRQDLATRKAVQRAQGILVTRGMTSRSAKLWLSLQARHRGLSLLQMAQRVVAEDFVRRQNPEPEQEQCKIA